MDRNIDRNLRMAKREARRFFGINRRSRGEAVVIIAMLVVFVGFNSSYSKMIWAGFCSSERW